MNLGYIVLFGILLLSCITCIILFRNYKREYITALHKRDIPLRLLSGLSFYIADISLRGRKPANNKLLYAHRIRIVSYIIIVFLICNTIGLSYLISIEFDGISSIFMVSRPAAGEGDKSTTIITDNDMYSGPLDITTKETSFVYQDKRGFFMLLGAK